MHIAICIHQITLQPVLANLLMLWQTPWRHMAANGNRSEVNSAWLPKRQQFTK